MASDGTYKVYPSGFVGSAAVTQTAEADLNEVARALLNRSQLQRIQKYTASKEIIELWNLVKAGSPEYKTFDFKERILKAAISHFGDLSLATWIQAQWDSPEFSDNHSRWIDETILYVLNYQRRKLQPQAWTVIIGTGGQPTNNKKFSAIQAGALRDGSFGEECKNISMMEFIKRWVRHENGIEDLIGSLNVLYGLN